MAALVILNSLQAGRLSATACPVSTSLILHHACYSSGSTENVKPLKNTKLSSMKRGTGGRASFSGIVATVFGAPGYIGNHVVNRLGKIGSQVIVPYRGDFYDLLRLRVAGDLGQILFVPFNLRNEESIYNAVKYSNVVINLVGRDYETRNFSYKDVNVEGAARIARISREAGVEKLVWISDLNACENPKGHIIKGGSKHLKTKWEGEAAVRKEFPGAIIFRPSFVLGPNDVLIRSYTSYVRRSWWSESIPMWKKGTETIKQPVFVFDLAQGIINAIRDKDAVGKTFQAIGPKKYRMGDLVEWFFREMRLSPDEDGYRVSDISKDFLFKILLELNTKLNLSNPFGGVTTELVERESITDVVNPKMPTLEDLGVNLTPLEHFVPWVLRPYREFRYYDEDVSEFRRPVPPQPVA